MSTAPRASILLFAAGLLAAATPVPAQQPTAPSFEAALKRACPRKNLEFLPPDILARTTDDFVATLPTAQAGQVRSLAEPGVKACEGSADESCRTAAVLGTLRVLNLSEPLAGRFCALPLACTDWFSCRDEAGPGEQQAAVVPPPSDTGDETAALPTPGPAALPPAKVGPEPRQASRIRPPAEVATPSPPPTPVQPVATVVAPARAREAVEGFYGALSRGDGITAASYLVPEKRGRGNFSAAAMQRFYGGLARPLALRSVAPAGPGMVSVRYDFVARDGSTCDGRAIIRVRSSAEGSLIETIRALSNC